MKYDEKILFTPHRIGNTLIKNRFIRGATYENAANTDGSIGEEYAKIYERLSQGEIGLIIPGMIYTSNDGKSYHRQAGLHADEMIAGFSAMNERVHRNGSKIFAQLCHGGRQTQMQGRRPAAPSSGRPDMIYQNYPRAMDNREIMKMIKDYGTAALRARKAGFDGIQIHAAHGYLISEFLSPFFNRRNDEWGGSPEKRFNVLGRVYQSIRDAVGTDYPVMARINIEDYTPGPGLTIEESAGHVGRLVEMGIDAVEISCGTLAYSLFKTSRGSIPVRLFSRAMIPPFRPFARQMLRKTYPEKNYLFHENYNLWACDRIKPVMGSAPLVLVGGLRSYSSMEDIIQEGKAEFVSMCRPFIRQPQLVKKWKEGDMKGTTCENCNKCFGNSILDEELRCNLNREF